MEGAREREAREDTLAVPLTEGDTEGQEDVLGEGDRVPVLVKVRVEVLVLVERRDRVAVEKTVPLLLTEGLADRKRVTLVVMLGGAEKVVEREVVAVPVLAAEPPRRERR